MCGRTSRQHVCVLFFFFMMMDNKINRQLEPVIRAPDRADMEALSSTPALCWNKHPQHALRKEKMPEQMPQTVFASAACPLMLYYYLIASNRAHWA